MEQKREEVSMNLSGWYTLIPHPIKGPDDAVALVTTLGFCTWGPVSRMAFPNLAEAMGETATSVLARTWFWKDDLHFAQQLYYGKIIAGQPCFIAPGYLADFIAALAGWGLERERDPIKLYLDGRLSREARAIYEYLVDHPAQPTREVRRGASLSTRGMKALTERALVELQRRFLICKVDVTGRTRGTYAYVWDLAERFWHEPFAQACTIHPGTARHRIRRQLAIFGIQSSTQLESKLFLWR
jgi:hypothetical protein